MRLEPSPPKASQRTHQHYRQWAEGDGATTVFYLEHAPAIAGPVLDVYVDGLLQRPAEPGLLHDYVYAAGVVAFTAPPAVGAPICFATVSV